MTTYAPCDYCAKLRRLDPTGRVVRHFTRTPERVRGTERVRKTRRLCPGSGRAPRPPAGGSR